MATQQIPGQASAPASGGDQRVVELSIQGMTCASCVGRVERKLGKLAGVEASVNLPLESAVVRVPATVSDQDLIDTVVATGYGAHVVRPEHDGDGGQDHDHDHTPSRLGARLVLAAVLSVPVLLISMVPALQFANWGWVVFALSLPVVTWSAWPFHRAAAVNARHFASTMDTLVSIGVTAAFLFSTWQLVADPALTEHAGMAGMDMTEHSLYFEVAAVVVTFLLLGRFLEASAKQRAGSALTALLSLGAKEAHVLRTVDGERTEVTLPAHALIPGDEFVVRPGEKIATDGVVTEGTSAVDTALLTGESVPVEVSPGDAVTGATINTSGRLVVTATRVGSDTVLSHMGRLVSQAQSGKARIARLADRISAVFVPVVLVLAVLTFVLWLVLTGDLDAAFTASVTVLVIACPCALGLATPTALLTGTGRGAQLGILIRGPQVLEDTRTVDTIVLDKTGTVTTGTMAVDDVVVQGEGSTATLLRLAGAVEAQSEHPIAQAIARHAAGTGRLPDAQGFSSAPGGGVRGTVDGSTVTAGRASWLEQNGIRPSAAQARAFGAAEDAGTTAVWVAVDDVVAGFVTLSDTVKDGSATAIGRLRDLGLRPVLLTGDNRAVALQVAAAVGIDPADVHAGVTPEGKVDVVRGLQAGGATVAMAGDGVNDAAALAQADLGIAMGSGTDVAIEAADLTVMGNSLEQVAQAIELSRRTLGTIKGNLFWAFFYNAVGIPVAAFGLLNPMLAGAAMAASSVLVVLNSLRLRRFGR
ncbi:copper-translocating P-type ATPase [Arthrobacter agilis]|uniref:heavy metal translocating P-type ATPase n=1 Tax=Arthrobacter agilis TaxID=37921 RepID=UPI000B363E47|nr:heavy metal translocating P-type ATPase [Arthrobacter agilis]OUM42194.1 copper-translocating P-type ATPase [Arthrobacter agilis]PPB45538.1 copper-translocating P-type ATPase [Arthrobacter agilis]TPV26486.1 copper-translocating P-type ATPase [Arthrobacter agilis]VDR33608.1 Copper-exporting P-type ATPase A [Arthrobacter agilis]